MNTEFMDRILQRGMIQRAVLHRPVAEKGINVVDLVSTSHISGCCGKKTSVNAQGILFFIKTNKVRMI